MHNLAAVYDFNEKKEYPTALVLEDDGSMSVCCNGKWYHSLTDMLMNEKQSEIGIRQ